MSLIVEDGTGLSTAQSYVSVADATTYHAAQGNAAWAAAATDALREAALVRATAAIDALNDWRGYRTNQDQALAWPRIGAVDDDGYGIASDAIPQRLKNAVCEGALVELASSGALTPELDRGGAIRRERAGAVEVEYMGGASAKTVYTKIDVLLKSLIAAPGRITRG